MVSGFLGFRVVDGGNLAPLRILKALSSLIFMVGVYRLSTRWCEISSIHPQYQLGTNPPIQLDIGADEHSTKGQGLGFGSGS